MIKDLSLIKDITLLFENKVIVWGIGKRGCKVVNDIINMGAARKGLILCDSSEKLQGKKVAGREVISPEVMMETLKKSNVSEIVICITIAAKVVQDNLIKDIESNISKDIKIVTLYAVEWGAYLSLKSPLIDSEYRKIQLHQRFMQKADNLNSDAEKISSFFLKACQLNEDIILIYQPGKVGSSSLYKSICERGINVLHCHHLLVDGKIFKEDIKLWTKNKKIKIISMVRDPIARQISAMWQNIPSIDRYSDEVDFNEIENYYFGRDFTNDEFEWFDRRINYLFNINVFDYAFSQENGYSIIEKDNIELLLIKVEKLSNLEKVVGKFLELEDFNIVNDNVANMKEYRFAYQQYKDGFCIPDYMLHKIYMQNENVKFFYSYEERINMLKKWMIK